MSLSTNWRHTGDIYVSQKDGNDGNVGDQANPYKTLSFAISQVTFSRNNIIIRSGYYAEGDISTINRFSLTGDGNVIIDGSSFLNFIVISSGGGIGTVNFKGLTFINCGNLLVSNSGNTSGANIEDCIIRNCDTIRVNSSDSQGSNRVLCTNSNIELRRGFNSTLLTVFRWSIIDSFVSFISSGGIKFNNVVTSNTSITVNDFSASYSSSCFDENVLFDGINFKNYTLNGDSNNIGTTYLPNERFTGTFTVGSATITLLNCFWTNDLGFNSPINDDYTLKLNPQSILFNFSDIIGCYGLAYRFDSQDQAFDLLNSGVSYTNLNRNVDGTFTLVNAGLNEGTVQSTDDPTLCFTLPEPVVLNQGIRFSDKGFTYLNGEWIDKLNYIFGVNEEVRLTYRLQAYDETEPNGVNSPLNFSNWYDMENNQAVELDIGGIGVGDVNVDFNSVSPLTVKRFRLEITLRNNGV